MQEILNSAEFFDWVALGLAMILAYILRHYWLWQVAGEKQMASHGVSLLIWLALGGALAFAISLRFGKGHGEEWIAGYFFEFFFMLENVFVFRAVITALSLSDAMVAKVLDWVVNCQIIFEAVFFLGLAHQLRALHLLPQVLGLGLLFFGLLTLRESFAKSKAESGVTSVLRSLSSSSLAGSADAQENEDFLCFKESRPKLTMGGTVLLLLLLVDFLCEIDTVLTKIEEIQSPFVAFSSSAMAAFALPELYMLSQDLLFHFPLSKHLLSAMNPGLACEDALLPEPLGSWQHLKEILVQILVEPRKGFEAFKSIADAVSSLTPELCPLGHYSLRVAFLIFRSPEERREELEAEDLPWAFANATTILSSGWPVYGLLGLLAYKLSRDGTAATDRCTQEAESFRLRYEDATLRGGEVTFSSDVENTAVELLRGLSSQNATTALKGAVATTRFARRGCLLGAGLPLLGYGASVSCLGRRDPDLLGFLQDMVATYEDFFLRPASGSDACLPRALHPERCQPVTQEESLPNLLSAGMWASESLHLLQRISETFALGNDKLVALHGGPVSETGRKFLVSVDPFEDQFHGYGLPAFTSHLWADHRDFRVLEGIRCPDVLIARDSLPGMPFPGALVYVDHEAGIGPGRDAGTLAEVLGKYQIVYLGVLSPFAATHCRSRYGTWRAQQRRVCAKVYDREISGSAPRVLYVPFASTSFAGRQKHTPLDLSTRPRSPERKPFLLAYMAYACVDHRERIFDLLVQAAARRGLEPPVALSRCAGYSSGHRRVRNDSRDLAASFLDEAVELLRPYTFALVFENKLVPGYVTEKIVNAFLAGCIPIYWGSRAVLDIFNPSSFIYANDIQAQGPADDYSPSDPLEGLQRVVDQVMEIAQDPVALQKMASEPILDASRHRRFFSWHSAVREWLRSGDHLQSEHHEDLLPERIADAVMALKPRRRQLCEDGWRICTAEL
ncbi:fucT [Symbiodinium necroappetens]|uniref:Fucosyltransferase n=1 Tax=Symbiodinium necroappetens TaxID=1628268 RepID=A0A813BCG8_9DINO|nr:fucT [Symbiodinium necroappetens]